MKKHRALYYWYWAIKLSLFDSIQIFKDDMKDFICLQVKYGLINSDGSPKHCIDCGHDEFKGKVIVREEGYICESQYLCVRCGSKNGYWAYGNWTIF